MDSMATATLTRIGNSVGVAFPKEICGNDFKLGDKISFRRVGPDIVVSPVKERPTLESLMEGYQGPKPSEIDFGETMESL